MDDGIQMQRKTECDPGWGQEAWAPCHPGSCNIGQKKEQRERKTQEEGWNHLY